jgi:type I site-specific restriction endonuclease
MEKLYQQHLYGWTSDKIRNNLKILNDGEDATYFDWLNFIKKNPESNLEETKQLEINNTISMARKNLDKTISSEQENTVIEKLNWMKNYIDTLGSR